MFFNFNIFLLLLLLLFSVLKMPNFAQNVVFLTSFEIIKSDLVLTVT